MTDPDPPQRLLDDLRTAVLVLDARRRVRYMNPAGEMLFEASARHAVGQAFAALFAPGAAMPLRLERGRAYTERGVELRLPDDRLVTVDMTVTPLHGRGRDRHLLLELVHIDRHLRIAREENLIAQHHNTRLLMRGMAHEINNPLAGLRGAAQLLETELREEALREYTRVIIGEADRLQSLLRRMLEPMAPPARRRFNVHEVVERVRALTGAEAPAGVAIMRDYDPSIPALMGDPDQLIQAVLNVTRNALQAVDATGTITLRTRALRHFTIGQRTHRLAAQIDVVDDGPGVPAAMRETIFYPMITGRAEGTGLGLPIAQSIVNQHGGLIECASRPGATTFSIILPFEDDHDH